MWEVFVWNEPRIHDGVMILMNLLTSVLPTKFPVSLNSMLPIGYLSRKPILDPELFIQKFIEPEID